MLQKVTDVNNIQNNVNLSIDTLYACSLFHFFFVNCSSHAISQFSECDTNVKCCKKQEEKS